MPQEMYSALSDRNLLLEPNSAGGRLHEVFDLNSLTSLNSPVCNPAACTCPSASITTLRWSQQQPHQCPGSQLGILAQAHLPQELALARWGGCNEDAVVGLVPPCRGGATYGVWDMSQPCSTTCWSPSSRALKCCSLGESSCLFWLQALCCMCKTSTHTEGGSQWEDWEERRALPERLHPSCALHPLLWLLLFFYSSHWGQFTNCKRS